MPKGDKLNAMQKAFARHYLVLGDAKAAAIKAGYSKNGAKQTAHALLKHPGVVMELSRLRQKAAETTDRLLTGDLKKPGADVAAIVQPFVSAVFDRTWVNGRLMESAEIGLGHKLVPQRKYRPKLMPNPNAGRGDAPPFIPEINPLTGQPIMEEYDEPHTELNLNAANAALALLGKELDRQVGEAGDMANTDEGAPDRFAEAIRLFAEAQEAREAKTIDVTPNNRPKPALEAPRRANGKA